jgi:spore coat polysaccharide biosynthesis protein SpsF (cytidylyltransferase family)
MVKNVICIVQARSNSSRFPNKIFAKIGELNLLQWVDQRLSKSTLINQVAFALPETDRRFNIANFVQSGTVHYVPIVESDVLGRYYSVASELSADIVVRVTCDCPFIDPNIVDGVISKFIELDEIYLSNTNPPSFPDGYDVEVMKFEALEEAFFNAKSQADREHVTPFIIRNYARNNFESFVDLSNARLTVDTVEDLERNNNIFANLNDYHFKYKDTVALWKSKPELFISATNRMRELL